LLLQLLPKFVLLIVIFRSHVSLRLTAVKQELSA
jgi:hypothetical protein